MSPCFEDEPLDDVFQSGEEEKLEVAPLLLEVISASVEKEDVVESSSGARCVDLPKSPESKQSETEEQDYVSEW